MLFLLMPCNAQWSTRATVEFLAGGSFPIGEFAYSSFYLEESGYAVPGIALGVSFTYRLNGHLGLLASVTDYILGVDESNIVERYQSWETGFNWEVEADRWKLNAFMGGIDIILPIYRSDFNFRLLGGFARTRLPGLTGIGITFHRESTTDIAAAWSAGMGYTYQYAEKITLSLRLDFFMTQPVLADNWSFNSSAGSVMISQNVSIVNLTAALGFRIF